MNAEFPDASWDNGRSMRWKGITLSADPHAIGRNAVDLIVI